MSSSGQYLTIPGDQGMRSRSSSLTDLISTFNTKAAAHEELQKVTAFSDRFDKSKPTFSKDQYGKVLYLIMEKRNPHRITLLSICMPVCHGPYSQKWFEADPWLQDRIASAEAQARVFGEMRELCEIVNEYGATPCRSLLPDELSEATKVIYFGELFSIYTNISDKLVGILLRTRKYGLTKFEGEVLFQKRDDDVPVFLMKTIKDIREYCNNKAMEARRSVSPNPQC